MSHIGKKSLKLPAGYSIELHSQQNDKVSPICWSHSEGSNNFTVSTIVTEGKNLLFFTGSNETFSSEIPRGFLIKAYPKAAFELSGDQTRLKVLDENTAYILLDIASQHHAKGKKGPQRRQTKKLNELWGTTQRIMQMSLNSCEGQQSLKISLKGLGYKAFLQENNCLQLKLGFSHSVDLQIPKAINVSISTEASTSDSQQIILSSYDKGALGTFGSIIRYFRPPEPYKGKGVCWQTPRAENKLLLRRKVGKEGN